MDRFHFRRNKLPYIYLFISHERIVKYSHEEHWIIRFHGFSKCNHCTWYTYVEKNQFELWKNIRNVWNLLMSSNNHVTRVICSEVGQAEIIIYKILPTHYKLNNLSTQLMFAVVVLIVARGALVISGFQCYTKIASAQFI